MNNYVFSEKFVIYVDNLCDWKNKSYNYKMSLTDSDERKVFLDFSPGDSWMNMNEIWLYDALYMRGCKIITNNSKMREMSVSILMIREV